MGPIADFVAVFRKNRDDYAMIEKEVEALCKEALRGFEFLWQSRVKEADSLEVKLRRRNPEYENDEFKNIAQIKDLVAGRVILARASDFVKVEEVVQQVFQVQGRRQHPKPQLDKEFSQERFRPYDGLHLHVTRRSAERYSDLVIEIQVMSPFMWAFSALEHDIIYKELHGKPDAMAVSQLELLKGIANLGEVAVENFESSFHSGFESSYYQQRTISRGLPGSMTNLIANAVAKLDTFNARIQASKDHLLDSFNSMTYPTLVFYSLILISYQEKSGEEYSAGCQRSSIEAIMRISPKIYCLSPGNG